MRIVIDTNVFLDVLLKRERLTKASRELLLQAADDKNDFFVAAKSLVDIYYHARKQLGDKEARRVIGRLSERILIVDTTGKDCLWALQSPVKDYEDAVLVEAAARAEMDAIVTRNKKDFKGVALPVWTPEEAVKKLG